MSIKYNGKIIAGNYKVQVIPDSDTVNKGKIRIATQLEIDNGIDNTTAVTPYYLSKKQDVLTAGNNISIKDNTINCDIAVDDETVIKNTNNSLTVIGQKTKSNTIKINWEGSLEEYENGLLDGSISPDWYCYIYDDEKVADFKDVITKNELEASNIYTIGLNELSDTEGYSQIESEYLNENSIDKIDTVINYNFISYGEPHITKYGILTNTNIDNFIYVNGLNFNNNDFYVESKITLSSEQIVNNNVLFHINAGDDFYDLDSYIKCYIDSSNNIILNISDGNNMYTSEPIELLLDTLYIIRVGYNKEYNQVYIKIYNSKNVLLNMESIQVSITDKFFGDDTSVLFIGNDTENFINRLKIDLNSLKIYVNNTKIYQACLKIPYKLSNYGSKIVNFEYMDRVLDWYEINNNTEYFIINTEKNTYYLPIISNTLSKILNMANSSLSNLTEDGEKHFLNYNRTSNCILEIPQRIKWSLENGALTIKAGSVVIVPYGIEDLTSTYPVGSTFNIDKFEVIDTKYIKDSINGNKFFIWVKLLKNISASQGWGTNEEVTWYVDSLTGSVGICGVKDRLTSGSTAPTATNAQLWYDTSTNFVKFYSGGNLVGTGLSLPLMIGTHSGDGITVTSIKQAFNGFGYIGNIFWRDKGIKGLIADGYNNDGTLRSIEITTDFTINNELNGTTLTKNLYPAMNMSDIIVGNNAYLQSTVEPTGYGYLWYNPYTNIMMRSGVHTGIFSRLDVIPLGEISIINGIISDMKISNIFKINQTYYDSSSSTLYL